MIRNQPKLCQGLTLEGWCLYLACPTGTSRWDKHNLSQWDRRIGTRCACPTACPKWDKHSLSQLGLGKVKREPFLVPWDKSYTHAGGLSLSQDKIYTHNGACPSSACPNLSHKVGLQGLEIFIATVLDSVRATFFVFSCIAGTFEIFCFAPLG